MAVSIILVSILFSWEVHFMQEEIAFLTVTESSLFTFLCSYVVLILTDLKTMESARYMES